MAVFRIYEAKPGNGKSLQLARLTLRILERNKEWYETLLRNWKQKELPEYYAKIKAIQKWDIDKVEKYKNTIKPPKPIKRKLTSNMKYTPDLYIHYEGYFNKFTHEIMEVDKDGAETGEVSYETNFVWSSWTHLMSVRDTDIIWDEISILLDGRKFESLTIDQTFWLAHYRRLGLDIYGATQHWSMVDRRARIMCSEVVTCMKFIGSPDPSPTRPKIKKVWGVIVLLNMDNFDSDESLSEPKYQVMPIGIFSISRKLINLYDTTELIKPSSVPLKHSMRKCLICGKIHIKHT
jgi:hypothetical protein